MDLIATDTEPYRTIEIGTRAGGGAQIDVSAVHLQTDQSFVAHIFGHPDASRGPMGLARGGKLDLFGSDAEGHVASRSNCRERFCAEIEAQPSRAEHARFDDTGNQIHGRASHK